MGSVAVVEDANLLVSVGDPLVGRGRPACGPFDVAVRFDASWIDPGLTSVVNFLGPIENRPLGASFVINTIDLNSNFRLTLLTQI